MSADPEYPCAVCGFAASADRAGADANGCCGACGLAIPAPPRRQSCDDGRGGCTQLRLRGECDHAAPSVSVPEVERALLAVAEVWDRPGAMRNAELADLLREAARTVAALTADRGEIKAAWDSEAASLCRRIGELERELSALRRPRDTVAQEATPLRHCARCGKVLAGDEWITGLCAIYCGPLDGRPDGDMGSSR